MVDHRVAVGAGSVTSDCVGEILLVRGGGREEKVTKIAAVVNGSLRWGGFKKRKVFGGGGGRVAG